MITLPSLAQLDRAAGTRIWLCTEPTDMRRSFDRLTEQAQQVTRQDPQARHVFVFRARGGEATVAQHHSSGGAARRAPHSH